MPSTSSKSAHLALRANWDWSESPWQAKAFIQLPASFVGLGVLVLVAGIISVVVARGRRSIFATLTAAIILFVVNHALDLAVNLLQYLADLLSNMNTTQNISSASTVLSGIQVVLDLVTFLLVLKDRKHAIVELAGGPTTKPRIGQNMINLLLLAILVILPASSLATGIINGTSYKAFLADKLSYHEYQARFKAMTILGYVSTGAFGVAIAILCAKTIALYRRFTSLGRSDVPTLIMLTTALPILLAELIVTIFASAWYGTYKQTRVDDMRQATVRFAVSLLFSVLTLAYYSVIASLGFMPKLWEIKPSSQPRPSKTAFDMKSESISTV